MRFVFDLRNAITETPTDAKLKKLLDEYELTPLPKHFENVNRFLMHIGECSEMRTCDVLTLSQHRDRLQCHAPGVVTPYRRGGKGGCDEYAVYRLLRAYIVLICNVLIPLCGRLGRCEIEIRNGFR